MLAGVVKRLEEVLFANRGKTLVALILFTLVMGVFAAQLRMSAGFDKQLPQGHEYIETFYQYRDLVFGANRIVVVVHAQHGDMWNAAFLKKLNEVTQAVMFLPGIDRRTVTSLWTPTTRVLEITEEGFMAEDVIGGNITPDALNPEKIARIKRNVVVGGYIGQLVANDNSGAMVVADLLESDPVTKQKLDYLGLSRKLEEEARQKLENPDFKVQIIGFAKQIGDIADGATSVLRFFLLAFMLTAARRSFTGLLIPGTMALVTAFVGFATLTLIPIPMIRELGITASIGVAYKIVTNLVMLPVAASYFRFAVRYVERMNRLRDRRARAMDLLARIAETRNAAIATLFYAALFAVAYFQSQGRQIGHLQPGAPELRADARYNQDANRIVEKFDIGLDVLSVVVETPKEGC